MVPAYTRAAYEMTVLSTTSATTNQGAYAPIKLRHAHDPSSHQRRRMRASKRSLHSLQMNHLAINQSSRLASANEDPTQAIC